MGEMTIENLDKESFMMHNYTRLFLCSIMTLRQTENVLQYVTITLGEEYI